LIEKACPVNVAREITIDFNILPTFVVDFRIINQSNLLMLLISQKAFAMSLNARNPCALFLPEQSRYDVWFAASPETLLCAAATIFL